MQTETFAARLRAIREERGDTMQQFADLLGTSKQVICRYENGQRTPKISVAAEYARILQVDLAYLLGQAENKKMAPSEDEADCEILQLFNQLSDEKKADILDYIRYKLTQP